MGKFQAGLFDELSVYVRHAAWLNAAVERPKNDKSNAPLQSRLERLRINLKDDDYHPELPPIDGAAYLLGYLFEIGPTMAGGAGAAPITHLEIAAWESLSGVELMPWEARFLRRLSFEYLGESHKAEKPDRKAPWQAADSIPDRGLTAKAMRNAIVGLATL